MVFPQALKEWDDTGYSGEMYDTAEGVQPIFYRLLLDHVAGERIQNTDVATGECGVKNMPG